MSNVIEIKEVKVAEKTAKSEDGNIWTQRQVMLKSRVSNDKITEAEKAQFACIDKQLALGIVAVNTNQKGGICVTDASIPQAVENIRQYVIKNSNGKASADMSALTALVSLGLSLK